MFELSGTLEQIGSTHFRLRTKTIHGFIVEVPTVGHLFTIANEDPLTEGGDGRYVRTSRVSEVTLETDGAYLFRTKNSVYRFRLDP